MSVNQPYLSREDRIDAAYSQLSRALETRAPECNGIDLFTTDKLTRVDIEVLKPICAACDAALLCRQYARAAKPKHGFWAGRNYGDRKAVQDVARQAG